jgi:hypothetical protein
VFRRKVKGEGLWVRMPYDVSNRNWLKNQKRTKPYWDKVEQRWELPNAWFNDLVERMLERFGKVYILQPYREQEKCAPACQNAIGHICQCSCMGENHGTGNDGTWFEVSDTFATRWGDLEIACRLLTRK